MRIEPGASSCYLTTMWREGEAKVPDEELERNLLLKTSSELLDAAMSETSDLLPGLFLHLTQSIFPWAQASLN